MEEQSDSEIFSSYGLPARYTCIKSAGKGGMKHVFVCNDSETGRKVAIAVPLKNTPELKKEFCGEASLTARLEHPNIVPVHEIGTTATGAPFYVMKLASGLTLANIIQKLRELNQEFTERYTLNVMVDIFIKIANAISFAHANGICHLDLKPENIQVGYFGEVLVLDWGLARNNEYTGDEAPVNPFVSANEINVMKTQNGIVRGTPAYMAPEQALGINDFRGPLSDIYSLGAILFAILTLHAPVDGRNSQEIIDNAAMGRLLTPSRYNTSGREIPPVLLFIAFKAMNRSPSKRYQNVYEIIQDIQAYQKGYPTLAENAGVFTRFMLMLKRKRLQFFLAASLFFILVMLIAFLMAKLYYKDIEINFYQSEAMEVQY